VEKTEKMLFKKSEIVQREANCKFRSIGVATGGAGGSSSSPYPSQTRS